MALTKINIGRNEDGSPKYIWDFKDTRPGYDENDPSTWSAAIWTGPATGTIKLSTGEQYDLDQEYIEVPPGLDGAVHHHIELQHQRSGKLNKPAIPEQHQEEYTVKHVCSEYCGAEAIKPTAGPAAVLRT